MTSVNGCAGHDADDLRHMRHALHLAARGLGQVAPNPAVGCILVRDGIVIARGSTEPGGRPHAEAVALEKAGQRARGATAYVTLEPCAHSGRTPPCADALIAAGVARVVIALQDPDPRTNGAGIARLRAAGIAVETGLLDAQAREIALGFLLRITEKRPMVSLKLATSLDGRIATATGASRWITGEAARRHGHMLRAKHDAILVGAGTWRKDRPSLDCRLAGLEARSPRRIVLARDGDGIEGDGRPLLIACTKGATDKERLAIAADEAGRPRIDDLLCRLAELGITRLLVEGGATVAGAFLAAGAVDRLYHYRAPVAFGGDGLAAIAPLGVTSPSGAPRFLPLSERRLGEDRLDLYARGA
ncbi:MAG: bifunctional diaminohydroxyphosphoribosylaminopyrimidine deaminase/5-amino-6-(5-phosphoribosylamino)uracil reductase RibD [Rhodothalassiaceae bacterium]